jgi:hypothetical protein
MPDTGLRKLEVAVGKLMELNCLRPQLLTSNVMR